MWGYMGDLQQGNAAGKGDHEPVQSWLRRGRNECTGRAKFNRGANRKY